ncbi:MAG: aminopeptidase P family protein [Deltaproteobacteria bacterium]|nr:aminopeptidase P family protein [Deltaproteobacteria bacterium]
MVLIESVGAVQERLRRAGLDGWLLYDFAGSNPTARHALGLDALMLSRRLFYLIPAEGVPTVLCHRIDSGALPPLPGKHLTYTGWRDLSAHLERLIRGGVRRVAMEYFPDGAIPSLSRIDAGTLEWLRRLGLEVLPSAELVQHFLCRLSPAQAEAHRQVATELDRIKGLAVGLVRERIAADRPVTEFELQQFLMQRFAAEGLVTDYPPTVAVGRNAADPHYLPSQDRPTPVGPDQVVLLDLLARHDRPVCAYADLTWTIYTGASPPSAVTEVFGIVVRARDAGLRFITERYDRATGLGPLGWEVDRAIREVVDGAGYGPCFPHRSGHNIGDLHGHGDGANIDDLETHDTRCLEEGLCFSLKPAIYLDDFGVRSEVNVYLGKGGPELGARPQSELLCLC